MSADKKLDSLLVTGVSKSTLLSFLSEHNQDKDLFTTLMDKVVHGKTQTIRRKAAYTLRNLELEYPGRLGVKEVEVMIDQLAVERDSSILRDLLRALSTINVDEDNEGRLIDQCFKFMKTDVHAVAVRYISLDILENACRAWPELSHELLPILKDQQNTGTDRYWIACQKAIKRLDS